MTDMTPQKVGNEILVNSSSIPNSWFVLNQPQPRVAALAGGGFCVVWSNGNSPYATVYGQFFNADGTKAGAEIVMDSLAAASNYDAAVAPLSTGGALVTWTSRYVGGTSSHDVLGQFINAAGTKIGSPFIVNANRSGSQSRPVATALGGGGFVIAWNDSGEADVSVMRAQIFDATGTKVGSEFLVSSATTSVRWIDSVTALRGGGFLVSWTDSPPSLGSNSVQAQIFDAKGTRLGGELVVTTTSDSLNPSGVTALDGGGFVVAWTDPGGKTGDLSQTAVRAQIFDDTGAKVGGEFLVNTTTARSQRAPSVMAMKGGGFLVAWRDDSASGGDASGSAVRAQAFDANGAKVGSEFLVNTTTANDQLLERSGAVTRLSNGTLVVAWADKGAAGGNGGVNSIRAQILGSPGASVTPATLDIAAAGSSKSEALAATAGLSFLVTRSVDTSGTVSVNYAVTGAGANPANAADFAGGVLPSGTLTFGPGETSKLITLTAVDDATTEPDETLAVVLSSPSNGAVLGTSAATGSILNDDASFAISAATPEQAEGDSGTTAFTFTVTRTGDTSRAATVAYGVTGSGSAPADAADFSGGVLPSGTLSFAAGDATKTVTVAVAGDTAAEPNETFTVTLSNPSGASLATATASATIANDDAAGSLDPSRTLTKIGGELLVVPHNFNRQTPANVTRVGDGFVMLWSTLDTFWSFGLTGQRYDASGTKVGAAITFGSRSSAVNRGSAGVAALADGGFVITWQENNNANGFYLNYSKTCAQVFDASGAKVGTEITVHSTKNMTQSPSVVPLTDGGFLVAWTDDSALLGDASGYAIHAQAFDAAGTKIGAEFLVNTTTAGDQSGVTAERLADGRLVMSWTDASQTGGDTSGTAVRAQIFDMTGTKTSNEFLVNTTIAGDQTAGAVTPLAGGGFLVTWTDSGSSALPLTRAQLFDATGAKAGAELVLPSAAIAPLPDGGFVVARNDTSHTGADTVQGAVYARAYDATGSLVGPDLLVNTTTNSDEFIASKDGIETLANGDLVVAWGRDSTLFDTRLTVPKNADIYAQILRPSLSAPVLSIAATASAKPEGTQAGGTFTFLVTRSGDLSGTTTVAYAVTGSGAAPASASDFVGGTLPQGTVTFAPGHRTARITVDIQPDQLVEGDETFTVTLGSASGGTIVMGTATGTIRNDDAAVVGGGTSDPGPTHPTTPASGRQPVGDESINGVVVQTRLGTAPAGVDLPFVETGIDRDAPTAGATVALMRDGGNAPLLQASVAAGGRITAYGPQSTVTGNQMAGVVEAMLASYLPASQSVGIRNAVQGFAAGAGGTSQMTVRTLTPTGTGPVTITGSSGADAPREALILNMRDNPGGSVVLNNVDFVAIVGKGTFTGGEGSSLTIGDDDAQVVNLGPDDDTTRGGGGDDVIASTTGRDLLAGDDGNDTLNGGADNDTLLGGADNDVAGGGAGDDLISGDGGNDTLIGEDGNDTAIGGTGNDVLFGMDGADLLTGDEGADTLLGGDGGDSLLGGAGNDLIGGGDGDDLIDGGDGNDTLIGEAGSDTLFGGAGDDALWGGEGDDWLIGGAGKDVFGFTLGGGNDLVFGFNPDEDLLGFAIPGLDLAQLAANARTVSGNTVFTLSDKSTVTVVGLTKVTDAWFS